MNTLVDTSVWVAHFRHRNDALVSLIERDMVLMHPMVLADLACGTPPAPRRQTLGDMGLLRQANQASLPEVMDLIERESLFGLGCGLVDMASHPAQPCGRWTSALLIWPGDSGWFTTQRCIEDWVT
jgi:hypothetical protein